MDCAHRMCSAEGKTAPLLPLVCTPASSDSTFDTCTLKSILTSCVISWSGNCSALKSKVVLRLVQTAVVNLSGCETTVVSLVVKEAGDFKSRLKDLFAHREKTWVYNDSTFTRSVLKITLKTFSVFAGTSG